MARRLIVDTGVLIWSERANTALAGVIDGDDDLVIAAITVAEMRTGIELASERHRPARTACLAKILEMLPVEPYDIAVAQAHGRVLAHVHRSGTSRGAHDLIIAATAIATRRTLLTTDHKARFQELPGLTCLVLP